MQRYFVQPEQFQDDKVFISGDDVHHISRVLRSETGDQLICSNGNGLDVVAEIIIIEAEQVVCKIISEIKESRESRVRLIVAQALPKADKMDLIVQKGTEIGASAFIPFTSKRTIVQLDAKKEQKRIERWQKIVKEAAEQAHRSIIPNVFSVMKWEELLKHTKDYLTLIAYEQETTQTIAKVLDQHVDVDAIMLIIGPEGGFTEEEIKEAEKHGAIAISLGKRILRTETAGMVGAANIFYHIEELRG